MINDYNEVFAKYYDLINSQKDYHAEALAVIDAINNYNVGADHTLADVGCGTGNYSIIFENHGFDVTGYDISSEMINMAKQKISNVNFIDSNFCTVEKKFDIITALFNVVNSLGNYNNLCQFFHSIAKSLKNDSLFIFDSWNGIAVFRNPPIDKVKIIEKSNLKIVREVFPKNDLFAQSSIHRYNIIVSQGEKTIEEVSTSLHNYFFTYQEINRALSEAGIEIIKIFPYKDLDKEVLEDDFIITHICKLKKIK